MLISIRHLAFPSLDASVGRLLVHHPRFRLRLAEFRGGIVEDRLFDAPYLRSTVAHWPILAITLSGRGVVRDAAAAASTAARDLVWSPRGAAFRARSARTGIRALILQWDGDAFGSLAATTFTTARLGAPDFARITAAGEQVVAAAYDVPRVSAAVAGLFATLHVLGLVGVAPGLDELARGAAGDIADVGAAMDRALSDLRAKPMSVDIEASLRRSAAQTRRLVHRYGRSLSGPEFTSWRQQRNLWRMYIGALLMTSPRAETEAVAHVLGYGSAAAFCHAFAKAGLPSPGNIRRVVDQLA